MVEDGEDRLSIVSLNGMAPETRGKDLSGASNLADACRARFVGYMDEKGIGEDKSPYSGVSINNDDARRAALAKAERAITRGARAPAAAVDAAPGDPGALHRSRRDAPPDGVRGRGWWAGAGGAGSGRVFRG